MAHIAARTICQGLKYPLLLNRFVRQHNDESVRALAIKSFNQGEALGTGRIEVDEKNAWTEPIDFYHGVLDGNSMHRRRFATGGHIAPVHDAAQHLDPRPATQYLFQLLRRPAFVSAIATVIVCMFPPCSGTLAILPVLAR